jgi:hypothetical protein
MQLTAGRHLLTLTVTGKNGSSIGCYADSTTSSCARTTGTSHLQ